MTDPDGVVNLKHRTYLTGHGQRLYRVHDRSLCLGRPCVIHNPSDHSMRSFPTYWRVDAQKMERICPHGVGHPDPDELAWHAANGRDWMGVHGCDGCCDGCWND